MNSSLFFCMISSGVKPWFPFWTAFWAGGEGFSTLAGSGAGAGFKREKKGCVRRKERRKKPVLWSETYALFWNFYSSCRPAPCLCLHLSSQSWTSQFFWISQTPERPACRWCSESCWSPPPPLWWRVEESSVEDPSGIHPSELLLRQDGFKMLLELQQWLPKEK